MKHENLLEEELDTTKKGLEKAQKLIEWYSKRMITLDKRKEMLNKGMVALDSAVHEQKLNFLRAQITELNRKIENLMSSSEKGFPSHQNMIRNPVISSNGRTSNSSTPDVLGSTSLQRQNQKLLEELETKSRLVEQLQREKRFYESQNVSRRSYNPSPVSAIYIHSRATPTAYVKPAMVHTVDGLPPSPVKIHDTLL
ncbi:hypothetical protein FO519_004744 [Halicephalobus sp. NKZ332]|nr:hypothetical protein FO519_004744 [Halicephalobus sp. NKZ332]